MKKIFILTLIMCFFSLTAYAVDGYMQTEYNFEKAEMETELYLYEEVGDFEVGGKFTTHLMTFVSDNVYLIRRSTFWKIYDLVIKYKINDQITLNFSKGIKQYFAQRWYNTNFDDSHTKLSLKYEF